MKWRIRMYGVPITKNTLNLFLTMWHPFRQISSHWSINKCTTDCLEALICSVLAAVSILRDHIQVCSNIQCLYKEQLQQHLDILRVTVKILENWWDQLSFTTKTLFRRRKLGNKTIDIDTTSVRKIISKTHSLIRKSLCSSEDIFRHRINQSLWVRWKV